MKKEATTPEGINEDRNSEANVALRAERILAEGTTGKDLQKMKDQEEAAQEDDETEGKPEVATAAELKAEIEKDMEAARTKIAEWVFDTDRKSWEFYNIILGIRKCKTDSNFYDAKATAEKIAEMNTVITYMDFKKLNIPEEMVEELATLKATLKTFKLNAPGVKIIEKIIKGKI